MRGERLRALAAFDQPRRAIAVGRPQAAALPAAVRIVDAAVEPLRVEARADTARAARPSGRSRSAIRPSFRLPVDIGTSSPEPERVVLIDPRVVARLGAVLADALEARARILVERPALGAVIAGRLRPVERPLALAAIEAAEMCRCRATPRRRPCRRCRRRARRSRAAARCRPRRARSRGGFDPGTTPHDRAGIRPSPRPRSIRRPGSA